VELVASQTGVSADKAREVLEEVGGDLAEAIMKLE
jgi:NACalpha-BTF3-like transcription factor